MFISKRQMIKEAGIFEPPPKLFKDMWEWARMELCNFVLAEVNLDIVRLKKETEQVEVDEGVFETHPVDNSREIVDRGLVKQKCLQYADEDRWADQIMRGARTDYTEARFPVNFSEWKYAKETPRNFGFMKSSIRVEIWFLREPHKAAGEWRESYGLISLYPVVKNITSVADLDRLIGQLRQTLYHELQHMGQSYLRWAKSKDPKNPHENEPESSFMGGFPSPSIQNKIPYEAETSSGLPKDYHQPERLLHDLRDIEFYTNLNDQIELLKEFVSKYPKQIRIDMIRAFINPKYNFDVTKMRKKLPYITDRDISLGRVHLPQPYHSPFFSNLLNYEPEKYRKAVTELFKKIMTETDVEYGDPDLSSYPPSPGKTPIFGSTVANYTNRRGAELVSQLSKEDRESLVKKYKPYQISDAFLDQTLDEYDAFINALNSQQLLAHKEAVEKSGDGREYYVTPRWRQRDEKGNIPEPKRDSNHNTIVDPHPKLSRKAARKAALSIIIKKL